MLDPWSRRAHPFKYMKKFIYWALFERHTLRGARAVCFTADEEATLAKRYFPFGKWTDFVVGAGIASPSDVDDAAVARLTQKYPRAQGKRIWLFLSRIHPKKALDTALAAFSRISSADPSLHFLIVGDGDADYVARLKALCARLSIQNKVTFAGPLYGAEKWAAFSASELFVLPSHQENFGIAVAEALSTGLPVCISRRINIWREVAAIGAGIVCEDTRDSVIVAFQKWQKMSLQARIEMRVQAIKCFQQNFHVSAAGDRLFQKLTEITAG
jgi:glycosyltransferase involved in cell wall biosynthesis